MWAIAGFQRSVMSGMVFTLTGLIFFWGNSITENQNTLLSDKKKQQSRLAESPLWHLGMWVCYLIYKNLWCSFPYKCLCSWATSGVSFLDDLSHPLRGASSTPLTILNLNALRCRLLRCLNTYSFPTLAP